MSEHTPREQLIAAVMAEVAAFQDGTDEVDEAAAARLGLNRTDLRCLSILSRTGPLTAGQLATAASLTAGAITTVVDRLTRAGYVQRVRDEQDRRRVTVEVTEEAAARFEEIWGPIGQASYQRLARRSDAELRAIREFLQEGRKLQMEHAAQIRSDATAATSARRGVDS